MGRYRIRVATGAWLFSGSHNRVQLWLVGTRGEAELQLRLRPARGQVSGRGRGPPTLARPGTAAVGRRGRGGRGADEGQPERAWEDLPGQGEDPEPGPGLDSSPSSLPPGSSQPPRLPQVTPGPRSMREERSGERLLRERCAGTAQGRTEVGDVGPWGAGVWSREQVLSLEALGSGGSRTPKRPLRGPWCSVSWAVVPTGGGV